MMHIQSRCLLILATFLFSSMPSHAQATLNVVASLPEYGALAKQVGGSEVSVVTLAHGTEDMHFVNPKPSYIRVLNKANVLIENGADMESGWLPPLIAASRNPKLVPSLNSPTRILAADFVEMLRIPMGRIDRSMGDIHPLGHPHFHLNPANAVAIAQGLQERFCVLRPHACSTFKENVEQFKGQIENKMRQWQSTMKPLQGAHVVEYHQTFAYLADSFGFSLMDELEPKPGIPPSAGHIRDLVPRMQSMNARLILIEPFHERKTPTFVARQTGAHVVVLPGTIGGVPGTDDYISLIDTIVSRLVEAANRAEANAE